MNSKIKVSTIYLICFLIFCLIFLIWFGIDAIEGKIDFEFFADTETYMQIADENFSYEELIYINSNLLGPYTILKILNSNYYLVFLLNCVIFCYFFYTVSRLYTLNRKILLGLLIISPIMFGSLIGINKEIFSLLVVALVLAFHKTNSYKYIILALIFSFFVRWQMALFVVIFFLLNSNFSYFQTRKLLGALSLLLIVSVIYPLNLSSFSHIDDIATEARENLSEGSGIYSKLIEIQNYPLGYVAVFIPKALFLLGGILFRFHKVFDWTDMYNNFFIFTQCLLTMILLIVVVKRKVGINNVFVYMCLLYCIIFCLSPIFAPRYLFPCYILLACALSTEGTKLLRKRNINKHMIGSDNL